MRGETHLGQKKQRPAGPRVGVLIPQLEQLGREDGRREETQEKEAADGQILDVLPTTRRVNGGEVKPPEDSFPIKHRDAAPRTDLVLGLAELLLDSLVQLLEGHSHDAGALVDGGHDGLDDAGQVDLQHLHTAVPHLLLGQGALKGDPPWRGESEGGGDERLDV